MPAKIVVSRRVASANSNMYLCRFMKEVVYNIKDRIIALIDFFYPPFSKLMDKQTFRYAACGGSNTAFDILLFISHHFCNRFFSDALCCVSRICNNKKKSANDQIPLRGICMFPA